MAPALSDPWFKITLPLLAAGANLKLHVPHDVFSTQRIDEGTHLLLDHLPPHAPKTVLDMGCGYGALGLPVAAHYPDATVEMVDRDLLAVQWSEKNAEANGLTNIKAFGSLGFRDVPEKKYDWILCNVPARIGRPFMENLLGESQRRLHAAGELRIVVIHDLNPVLEEINKAHHWGLVEIARGPRHTVFALRASDKKPDADTPDLYFRDRVEIAGLTLDRPFDLGGDDPKRLAKGLPVLIDVLPRQTPKGAVFCFRVGYGPLPLLARTRWPENQVVAVERDLLATTFTRRNAEALGLAGPLLDVKETAHFPDLLAGTARYGLIVGELSPSAGEKVAAAELEAIAGALAPGGKALLLGLEKLDRDWVRPFAAKKKMTILPLITRDGHTVLSLT